MNATLKKFIEDNIKLIEADTAAAWEELYKNAHESIREQCGELTSILLDADIHPEEFLDNLPSGFLANSKIEEFIIPSNIREIGFYSFFSCEKLRSIIIPSNIISIKANAFSGSGLEKIFIPNTAKLNGISIFSGCSNLLEVELEEGLIEIPGTTFAECEHLSIVTIPKSVKRVGYHAFAYCGKNLTINFGGTTKEWKALAKEVFAYTHYLAHCTDGDISK